MAAMRWQIRAFAPAADRLAVEGLWVAAMPPAWPLLQAGIARLGEGLVAEADSGLVGFVAVDLAGSIPLILVAPAYQRRGIGTALLAAAVDCLRRGGSTGVTAGSGGRFYIWPGVPRDLPGAVRFFAMRGWQHIARPGRRGRARTPARPRRRDDWLCRRGGAQARGRDRHRLGRTRFRNPPGRRHPQLSHWLDNARILLLPRRLPALAAICHVHQTRLITPVTLAREQPLRRPWTASSPDRCCPECAGRRRKPR
jgi:GNAT superfamily N-acetyltransferase